MKFMSFQSWLAQTIADDGCCQSENISYLWADPNQEDVLDYFATQYDLNTVRMEDVQAAADEMYQKTQAAIASDFPDEIQVWRCGGLAGDVTSVTTNKRVADGGCSGGYYGGKGATVASYMVNRSDVLVSVEHLWPAGDFVEDELLVRPGSLRPMKESLLREYIRELIRESHFPLTGGEKVRIHHSRQDTRDGKEPQVSGFSQEIGYKPDGLWYECQDGSSIDWKEFCRTGLTDGASRYDSSYDVILNDYEILFITNNDDFKKFNKMYGVTTNSYGDIKIDWPKVASHYDGIEICPYLHDMRMDSDWYYGWDVASGCVWNASGIKELISADEGCKDESAA